MNPSASKRQTTLACWSALALAAAVMLSGCQSSETGGLPSATTTSTASAAAPSSVDYAITNVTLIDAVQGERSNQTVYIKDGSISAVVSSAAVNTATSGPSARWTIDGSGKYLIPGLWDMHVHITYEAGLTRAMPDLFLSYGVTSVRDTGGLLAKMLPEIERWRAADARAPRIFFSGPLLDGSNVVYDGNAVPEIGTANATPEMARANIAKLKAAGVDFVKTYELITPDVFAALTTAARDAGLPIASHVPLMMPAREAGPMVDSMEHLRNIELDCAANAPALLAQRSKQLLAVTDLPGIKLRGNIHSSQRPLAFAAYDEANCDKVIAALKNTIQVPTLRLNTGALYAPFDRPDWQAHVQRLPEASRQPWLDTAKQWSEQRASLPTDSGKFSLALIGRMNAAGVPIGAGTDTPIGSALPGYSLHTELERLVEAGLTPLDALRAATIAPARFVRKEAQMGQIKSGHVADLVLLNANPLTDIRNTRSINTVISKGEVAYTAN